MMKVVCVRFSSQPVQLVTGRTWKGSAFGGVRGRTQLPEFVENYKKGQLKIDEFITHNFPLEQINDAFHELHEV